MARDYLIATGGTGARCLEAFSYLAAAGLVKMPVHVLIIDPDQNNGNSVNAEKVISAYHSLHLAKQPAEASHKGLSLFDRVRQLDPPTLFQAPINESGEKGDLQHPIYWHNPNSEDRRFKDIIGFQEQTEDLRSFLRLFYNNEDLDMVLDVGYRGRTNIGAVALKQDLESTAEVEKGGLREFLADLNNDLQSGQAKIFVIGSVFGGTGAAAIPTIPALMKSLPTGVLAPDNRTRIRYGCAMLSPYFSFPQGQVSSGPGTDSSRHAVATQAALLHYAHVHPGYQHVYFVGAPGRPQTNSSNSPGGNSQTNEPHYIELIAALAANDFFSLDHIHPEAKWLHFADTVQGDHDLGFSWETLPVHPDRQAFREEIKQKMVTFATLAYFYKNFLYEEFKSNRGYRHANWYMNNFENNNMSLDSDGEKLEILRGFCDRYLKWLNKLGKTGADANPRLFLWDQLIDEDERSVVKHIGNLLGGTPGSPLYASDAYDRILKHLDEIRLVLPRANSPIGLFIYLLYIAVKRFCEENYAWKRQVAKQ